MKAVHGSASPRWRAVLIGMGVAAWGVAVAWQFHNAMTYESTPGSRSPQAPKAEQAVKSRLVVVVHPDCPCTKATLGQLREIVAKQGDGVQAKVIVAREDQASGVSENERLARAIPGVEVETVSATDPQTLGAKTSGESFYFDKGGKLVYHGGLTEGRGVQQPSRGAYCMQNGTKVEAKYGEVYGCPLQH